MPDCVVLFRRLLSDDRLPRRIKFVLVATVQLDDAIVVASRPGVVAGALTGPDISLDALLRLATGSGVRA